MAPLAQAAALSRCTVLAAPSGSLLPAPSLGSDPIAQPELQMSPDFSFPLLSPVSDSVGSQPWKEPGREAAGSFPELRRSQPPQITNRVGRRQAQGLELEQGMSLLESSTPGQSKLPGLLQEHRPGEGQKAMGLSHRWPSHHLPLPGVFLTLSSIVRYRSSPRV